MLVLVLVLVLVLPACTDCGPHPIATPPDAAAPAPSSSRATPVNSHVERARAAANVPAVAWARFDLERQYEGVIGRADVERDRPATLDTLFQVASIAKPILATAVMQLVEERRLDLDADVTPVVGFRLRPDARITLRQLLTHTSSIVDRPDAASRSDAPLGTFLERYFATSPPLATFLDERPGTTVRYSNVGFSVAALAVERVSGEPYFERVRRRIFEPLGMRRTRFRQHPPAEKETIAEPYAASATGFLHLRPPIHALYPVVDLFATPHDLARFGRAILRKGELDGRRVLGRSGVEAMLAIASDAAPESTLGWQIRTIENPRARRVVGHEGEDEGASTGLFLDLSSERGAVVLTNGNAFQSGSEARAAAIQSLLGELLSVEDR